MVTGSRKLLLVRILNLVALVLASSLTPAIPATAQPFYGVVYRPSDVRYNVISTEHFEIIYQRGLDSLAFRLGDVAETSYPEVATMAGLEHRFRLPIILNGYNDASNGFVSPLPFRMEIDAAPIKGKILNPRHEDWFAQVVPHELAHAAQAEIRGGFGVGALVRLLSPDWARALNFGVPRGITEGFAVSYESRDGRLGRLNHSFSMMEARAAATTRPWTLSQVLDPPGYTRPFDRFYVGGGILYEYLSDSLRADFLVNAARFYNRWPFLGFGVATWQSLSMPPWTLNDRFLDYIRDVTARSVSSRVQEQTALTDEPGLACRRPKWLDDATIVAHCSGYNTDAGFYRIDASTGERTLVLREGITEDYFLSLNPQRDELLFAEYDPLPFTDESFYSRVKRLDLASGRVAVVVGSKRLYAPVRLSGDAILAVENDGPLSRFVRLDAGGTRQTIYHDSETRFLEAQVNGKGEMVALINRKGAQVLARGSIGAAEVDSLAVLLIPVRGSIYDPSFVPGSDRVVFTADPDGIANVYSLETKTGLISRLTDAAFGAFESSVSPDGRRLAFVEYVHEQYQIVVKAVDEGVSADSLFEADATPSIATRSGSAILSRRWRDPASRAAPFTPHPEARIAQDGPRPYRPFPAFVRPRSVLPVIRLPESELSDQDRRLDPGFGLSVGGTDPLRQWAYSATGFFQANRLWGNLSLQTGTHILRPFITISDRPRSTVRPVDGVLARLAYEERSIETGGMLPVRLSSGGYQTFLAAGASGEYRSIRLIDSHGDAITGFDDRVTVNPFLFLGYRLKANRRDIIPNHGLALVSRAELDVRTEDVAVPSRSWRSDATVYLPIFPETSTRVAALLGVLWQNRGLTLDTETFLPRGYGEDDDFLGGGTFLKAGLEIIQPVAWVDRGIVLIPLSLQAIYLYGFAESLGRSVDWTDRRSSAGTGLGIKVLVGHHLRVDLRIGLARLLEQKEWAWTGR